jgi:hypothetical protein
MIRFIASLFMLIVPGSRVQQRFTPSRTKRCWRRNSVCSCKEKRAVTCLILTTHSMFLRPSTERGWWSVSISI